MRNPAGVLISLAVLFVGLFVLRKAFGLRLARTTAEEVLILSGSPDDLAQPIADLLARLHFRRVRISPDLSTISATGPTSIWSWGESITLRFSRTEAGAHSIVVSSRPIVPTTVADHGRNTANVHSIVECLRDSGLAERRLTEAHR